MRLTIGQDQFTGYRSCGNSDPFYFGGIELRQFATLLFILTLSLAATANAAVIFSVNFNNENGGVPVLGTTTLTKFNVVLPNVDVIGQGNGGTAYDFYPGNGLYLDLDGTTGATNAQIVSNMVFGPGAYTLTFLLGNNPGGGANANTLTVSMGDYSNTFTTVGNMPLTQQTLAFTTTVAGSLTFTQGGPADQQGSIIDNVQVSGVPEPGSIVLMSAGAAVLGLLRLKRSR